RPSLAAIGAAAWGTCPSASGTLGWYSVYGQVAATTCILLLLLRLTVPSDDEAPLSRHDSAMIFAYLGLSILFFGTAVAVALALPLATALLFPGSLGRGRRRRVIAASAAMLGLFLLLQTLGSLASGVPHAPMNIVRWGVTSPMRVVRTGVHLLRVGFASLLLGGWWQPNGRSDLLSWLALAGGTGGSMTAFAVASPQRRRVLLAFIVLAFAVYALIALGRGPSSAFLL